MTALRIGLNTPVVTRFPGAHQPWESAAGIGELARIAVAADHAGFHHLTCSEHVAVPAQVAEVRGRTYWDPLATLGFLAARTERIRPATQVLVLGYHHPLEIAKRYGTLDAVSGGRLILGTGVGSLREEFELLDVPFDDRGPRADDALRALRAALSDRQPRYHGAYYEFSDLIVDPHAVQPRVPLWVGGRTQRSLRRACDLADGWVPFGLSLDQLGVMLSRRPPLWRRPVVDSDYRRAGGCRDLPSERFEGSIGTHRETASVQMDDSRCGGLGGGPVYA